MSTAKDRLAAKAERLRATAQHADTVPAAGQAPPPAVTPAVPAAPVDAVQVKPVRLTLDLPPARYRDLQNWLNESAVRLGRSRVTKQAALEALVGLLLHDERTTQLVLKEIRES
jgi:hypothetical protein